MNISENISEIDTMREIEIYFTINEIGGFIWRMNHDMADVRIPEDQWPAIDRDIKKMSEIQQHAISILPKFGVTPPFRDPENKLAFLRKPSAQYWAWFRWWDGYIKGLSEEEWEILSQKIDKDEDISSYRPSGAWQDNVAKEEENIKKSEEFWNAFKK